MFHVCITGFLYIYIAIKYFTFLYTEGVKRLEFRTWVFLYHGNIWGAISASKKSLQQVTAFLKSCSYPAFSIKHAQ